MKTKLVWNKEKTQCERVIVPDNKIKVIDLLNKIANEEELPKRFKYDNLIWNKEDVGDDWFNEMLMLRFSNIIDTSVLNNEIEIIDELEETEDSPTISEEQALFNKLNSKDQEYILHFMRMLQPCEEMSDNNEY